jgi:hypothetical protein
MIGEDDNHEVGKDSNFESEKLSAQVFARDIGFFEPFVERVGQRFGLILRHLGCLQPPRQFQGVDHHPYNTATLRINQVKN